MLAGACNVGQRALRADYPGYNQVIRDIEDEHMLLNLVRLRYVETPVFLQIASITTTYGVSVNNSASVTGGGGSTSGTVGVGGSYSETPTISYSLPESREFFGRMQAPLSASQLAILGMAGAGGYFRMGVKTMNGLRNVSAFTGFEATRPPSNERFEEVMNLIEQLEREELISFAIQIAFIKASSPFPEINDTRAIPEAESIGMEFYHDENGQWLAYYGKKTPHLRFGAAAAKSRDAARLRELLGLSPDQHIFPIVDIDFAVTESSRVTAKGLAAGLDPSTSWTELALQNRSMGEVMLYASKSVQVPQGHLDAGLTSDEGSAMGDLLTIENSLEKPTGAAVAVQFKGHWFYIRSNDLESKLTFARLNSLFAVTAGTVPGSAPVLTIPVN
jgi:hypothetical protein